MGGLCTEKKLFCTVDDDDDGGISCVYPPLKLYDRTFSAFNQRGNRPEL